MPATGPGAGEVGQAVPAAAGCSTSPLPVMVPKEPMARPESTQGLVQDFLGGVRGQVQARQDAAAGSFSYGLRLGEPKDPGRGVRDDDVGSRGEMVQDLGPQDLLEKPILAHLAQGPIHASGPAQKADPAAVIEQEACPARHPVAGRRDLQGLGKSAGGPPASQELGKLFVVAVAPVDGDGLASGGVIFEVPGRVKRMGGLFAELGWEKTEVPDLKHHVGTFLHQEAVEAGEVPVHVAQNHDSHRAYCGFGVRFGYVRTGSEARASTSCPFLPCPRPL